MRKLPDTPEEAREQVEEVRKRLVTNRNRAATVWQELTRRRERNNFGPDVVRAVRGQFK